MPSIPYGTRRVREVPSIERNTENIDITQQIRSLSDDVTANTTSTTKRNVDDVIINPNAGLSAYAETEELKRKLRVVEDQIRMKNAGYAALLQIEELKRSLSELEQKIQNVEQIARNGVPNDGLPKFTIVSANTFQKTVVSKTADYTVVQGEGSVYIGNAASGAVTFTLPPCAACVGLVLTFKKQDPSGNAVIIDGNASEKIDGSATKSLGSQFHSITIISNGTGWSIIGELD
tara:strand:- start:176 stop:874 length:699 start_codon:yes stop_codon:yes gene_type:complete